MLTALHYCIIISLTFALVLLFLDLFLLLNDWVRKYMECGVEGARPRGGPKRAWREIVERDCQAHGTNREEDMDHDRWRRQIRDD